MGNSLRKGTRLLEKWKHTKLHRRLNEFLDKQPTKFDPVTGRHISLRPNNIKGEGGALVRRVFSLKERVDALDKFYRQYNGGEYYKDFIQELVRGIKNNALK